MTRFENDHSDSHPAMMELEAGTHYWCQCGKTKDVPWCDGSHEGTGVEPLAFDLSQPTSMAICNCGLTDDPPYCSGAHVEIE